MLVCTKIEKVDSLFQYVGVNLRVTFDGVAVTFPSGYGITQETKEKEDQIIFNSFNSVIAQFDPSKKVLRMLKEAMPFDELRQDIKDNIRLAIQQMQNEKIVLTKEMLESSEFPCDKFAKEFTSK